MNKPVLLDLYCGAGGCAKGYQRAGFYVIGVDIEPQPRYCGDEFIKGNALWILEDLIGQESLCPTDTTRYWLEDIAVIHASPPCQAYSRSRNNGCHKDAPRLLGKTRLLLEKTGRIWVLENVPGAPMRFVFELCGASFGLGASGFDLSRHRWFESSEMILCPPCEHRVGKTMGVYGNGTNKWHLTKFGRCITDAEKKEAMGIDWMTRKELTQAIPPAYTEYIGNQLIRVIA